MLNRLLTLVAIVFASSSGFSQALWLRYPAISPDGKNIVFSYRGDLYITPTSGGIASPLTVHDAYDFSPVWSPDGKQIAFASNRHGNFDVFIISLNGGDPKRLTYHSAWEIPTDFTSDGKNVIFSTHMEDLASNVQFPMGGLNELYSVPVEGGRTKMIKATTANDAQISKDGNKIIFTDWKGYEDEWRKHHQSSVTRDVWLYDVAQKKHTQLSAFKGEDRNAVFAPGDKEIYFLTEQFGDFNVAKMSLDNPQNVTVVTNHQKHPVRFLSIADDGTLCYSFNGELYTRKAGDANSTKVNVNIITEDKEKNPGMLQAMNGATEFSISPEGKEVAVIVRGEVFVTSTEHGTTKRITHTPEQERSVSFSPDGKSLIYASERGNSWKLYQTKLVRPEEKLFSLSTVLKEEPILVSDKETYQPKFSPDGKEVAYLEERVTLKVLNLATKQSRTILDGKYNYSYSDGDQWYDWSPDGKWFLVNFNSTGRWSSEVGLVDAQGKQTLVNLTNSGYNDSAPRWMQKGKSMIWFSDRNGMRSHASWGAQADVYAMYFTRDAWSKFKLSKEEFDLLKEVEKEKEEKKEEKTEDTKKKKGDPTEKDKDKKEKEKIEPVEIELDHIEDRKARLTIHSSDLSDAILSLDGEQLFYLAKFEKGYDLWVQKFRDHETKLLVKLEGYTGGLQMDKEGKFIFAVSGGNIIRIDVEKNEQKSIGYKAEIDLDFKKERDYMFEHVWRQVQKKFYNEKLHGVDWNFYKQEYSRFLPHINNNFDYTEMLSEMLGELNASHTGSGYIYNDPNGDRTARLGAFFDDTYTGTGLKISEVIEKGPLEEVKEKITAGMIIKKIDGIELVPTVNYYQLLNRKAGQPTLLSIEDVVAKKTFDVVIKPIDIGKENELLYERWVKKMRDLTDKLSGGKIGYTHVRGMDDESFRESYSEILGRMVDKKALIVDTRFNGGGWLHDDLASLLSGKRYVDLEPRGQKIGSEPEKKWYKPSVVLMSESNYSDAHFFPFTYKALNIGKLVGMPVPGTATAVWWELIQDNTIYFGIPQVGVKDMNGNYLENQQLEPDYKVAQSLDEVIRNRDEQLEKAVEVLLKDIK